MLQNGLWVLTSTIVIVSKVKVKCDRRLEKYTCCKRILVYLKFLCGFVKFHCIMGGTVSRAGKRVNRRFNIENRAQKAVEKMKTDPASRMAPKHESTKKLLDDFQKGWCSSVGYPWIAGNAIFDRDYSQ